MGLGSLRQGPVTIADLAGRPDICRCYVCMACGMVLDRDLNAAKNLAARGEAMVAGSGPETVKDRKSVV